MDEADMYGVLEVAKKEGKEEGVQKRTGDGMTGSRPKDA